MVIEMEMILQLLQDFAGPVPSLKNLNGTSKTPSTFIIYGLIRDIEIVFGAADSVNKIMIPLHVIEDGINLAQRLFGFIIEMKLFPGRLRP